MALKDEWQVDIDLSCIERYITDLAKTVLRGTSQI